MEDNKQILLEIVANNIRNLYRLVGIDLSDKEAWSEITKNTCYYKPPDENGVIWIPLGNFTEMITSFVCMTYEEMHEDFEQDGHELAKHNFGHVVYKLVGTRDLTWKRDMNVYKTFRS